MASGDDLTALIMGLAQANEQRRQEIYQAIAQVRGYAQPQQQPIYQGQVLYPSAAKGNQKFPVTTQNNYLDNFSSQMLQIVKENEQKKELLPNQLQAQGMRQNFPAHNSFSQFPQKHEHIYGAQQAEGIPHNTHSSIPKTHRPGHVNEVSYSSSNGSYQSNNYDKKHHQPSFSEVHEFKNKLEQGTSSRPAYQNPEYNIESSINDIDTIRVYHGNHLRQITDNYKTLLGKGGFGDVYLGILHDGQKVAVKVPIYVTETNIPDFKKELRIQSRIKHRNVVKLLGYCLEGDVPKFVYEFAESGNLYDKLHGNNKGEMSLGVRLRIALECAEALAYIHSSTDSRILHGDVKSANILLDSNLMAKVSDFGLSRLLSASGYTLHTQRVICSNGYGDPKFKEEGILTQKSDVYSFGVVLVELITRRKAFDDCGKNELALYFRSCFTKGKRLVNDMVDKEIAKKEDMVVIEEIFKLAFKCLSIDIKNRPDMKKVAQGLLLIIEQRRKYQLDHKGKRLHIFTSIFTKFT